MFRVALILICLAVVYSGPTSASAQFSQTPTVPGSSLVTEPRFPEPGQTVTLRLNDFSLNTSGAAYSWFINETELTSAANQRSITLTAPALGQTTTVRTVTTLSGGATVSATATIQPVRVDILLEADTLVPSFYLGRPLPSSGSTIRATALPFLSGASTNPSQYAYTWKLNGNVVDGGSRTGMNSTVFSIGFGRNVELTVDVADRLGNLLVSKTVYVPIANPELHFYVVDPLQGLLEQALSPNSIFTGEEMRLRAEPYYVSRSLLGGNVLTEWKLNNRRIDNPNTDQQEIVLRRSGETGNFKLGFHIRNLNQLLQGAEASLSLRF